MAHEPAVLSVVESSPSGRGATAWLKRRHPWFAIWDAAEQQQRASYLATRELLAPYLVLHRFEEEIIPGTDLPRVTDPRKLRRAKLGYGIAINRAYVAEIMGHIRSTRTMRDWGPLSEDAGPVAGAPSVSVARQLWDDVTRQNVSWEQFFGHKVLEWALSSPGGFVLLDTPPGRATSAAAERAEGRRPFTRFVPLSHVEDLGRGPFGFDWVKVVETVDPRDPRGATSQQLVEHRLIYELQDIDGATHAICTRFDEHGLVVPPEGSDLEFVDFGTLVDREGQPTLPLVRVGFGEHPRIPWLGGGLLTGLDEIVIDLYNTLTEVREGYRDVAFGILAYTGPDAKPVWQDLKSGSRLVNLGTDASARLERLAAESAEVDTGLRLIELGIRAWALSAKRKAMEAAEGGATGPRSGVSLRAEFELDLKPLLVDIAGMLDDVETNTIFLAAQLADEGLDPGNEAAQAIDVTRSNDFRPEDEASRIARIVGDFIRDVQRLPAEAMVRIFERWAEAADLFALDEELATTNGQRMTLRDLLRVAMQRTAEEEDRRKRLESENAMPLGGELDLGGLGAPPES